MKKMENKLKNSTLVMVCEQIMAANMAEYGDERIARQESARDFWDLITGDADREEILEKYNIECLRVCEMCGELMDEGWVLTRISSSRLWNWTSVRKSTRT